MEFTLNLNAERSVVRESVKGILWTIFFHRIFGPVSPSTSEFLDVPYPTVESMAELDTLLDEKINQLIKNVFSIPPNDPYRQHGVKTGEVIVQFLDVLKPAPKKKTGWFGLAKAENEVHKVWESWVIVVRCFPVDAHENDMGPNTGSGQSQAASTTLGGASQGAGPCVESGGSVTAEGLESSRKSFEENLGSIVDIADSHKDHIPQIMSLETCPFPYTIEVGEKISGAVEYSTHDDGWGVYIKKMLD